MKASRVEAILAPNSAWVGFVRLRPKNSLSIIARYSNSAHELMSVELLADIPQPTFPIWTANPPTLSCVITYATTRKKVESALLASVGFPAAVNIEPVTERAEPLRLV